MDFTKIIHLALEAGKAILEIYNDEKFFSVIDFKADKSPLTLADKKSHDILSSGLKEISPDIPVLSEEGKDIPYEVRKGWSRFWLVDPLDGTKEFIKRNGEFTINIALMERGYPVAGLIYAPDPDLLYFAEKGSGAYKVENGTKLLLPPRIKKIDNLIAVRSRSHASAEEDDVYTRHHVREFVSVGSALKFCMIADGRADLYYRHGPTMEWDTAAGQAIVEEAGAMMVDHLSGERFGYNKISLRNSSFLVSI